MNKGDILYGRKGSDAIHPIIYLVGHDENFFIGAMLTKSGVFEDNILMQPAHFKTIDIQNIPFEFQFNNTHLVPAKLIKRMEWSPFRKIGELSEEGLNFVELNMGNKVAQLWEEYNS